MNEFMTSTFLQKISVRLKYKQSIVYRIKFQHLKRITAMGWKNVKHVRKIHVSIMLIVDASISLLKM
ncbi:hypothetical protein A130_02950 [Vibrio genomosp. F6 str. FF-238]|uniref:Uncharacterized protein n=1 Tax=Vibrio genomosp. F6 str. FF-238 TaxID=1191298 RepID=A0A1E5D5M6_9VIBR|nr:hypothetical protein A130_02950 [Vibrio genomosp. F6 str. FF-238]